MVFSSQSIKQLEWGTDPTFDGDVVVKSVGCWASWKYRWCTGTDHRVLALRRPPSKRGQKAPSRSMNLSAIRQAWPAQSWFPGFLDAAGRVRERPVPDANPISRPDRRSVTAISEASAYFPLRLPGTSLLQSLLRAFLSLDRGRDHHGVGEQNGPPPNLQPAGPPPNTRKLQFPAPPPVDDCQPWAYISASYPMENPVDRKGSSSPQSRPASGQGSAPLLLLVSEAAVPRARPLHEFWLPRSEW